MSPFVYYFYLLLLYSSFNIVSIVCVSTSSSSVGVSSSTEILAAEEEEKEKSSSLFYPSLPTAVANGDANLLEFTSHHIRGNSLSSLSTDTIQSRILSRERRRRHNPPPKHQPQQPLQDEDEEENNIPHHSPYQQDQYPSYPSPVVPLPLPSTSPTRTTFTTVVEPSPRNNNNNDYFIPLPSSSSSFLSSLTLEGGILPQPSIRPSSSFPSSSRYYAPYLNIGPTYASIGDTFLCPLNRTLNPPPTTIFLGSEFKVGNTIVGNILPIAYVNISVALFNADPSSVVVNIYNSDGTTHLPTTLVTGGTSIQTSVVATQTSGTDSSVVITELIAEFFPWVNLTFNGYYYLVYSLTTPPSSGNTPVGCIVSNLAPDFDPFVLYEFNSEIVTRTTDTGPWVRDTTTCTGLAGCTTWFSLYGPGPTPSTSPSLSATGTATLSSFPTPSSSNTRSATRSSMPTLTMSLSSTYSAMSTLTASVSSEPSSTASFSSLSTYSATQSATMSATSTSSLNITYVDNAPPDNTPLIIGASVGSIVGLIVIGGGIFVCIRLAWEGRGPWSNRPIPHGPKQFKDRSVSARFDRRLKQYQNPDSLPAGTYASKHPQAVPQGDSLRMMADAYAAIYADQGGIGNTDIDYSNKSTLPLDNLPHADLVAASNTAEEWGSNRHLNNNNNNNASARKLNQKARFTPLAASSRTGMVPTNSITTTNPVATTTNSGGLLNTGTDF